MTLAIHSLKHAPAHLVFVAKNKDIRAESRRKTNIMVYFFINKNWGIRGSLDWMRT